MRRVAMTFVGAALLSVAATASPAAVQTFQTYTCADGSQFIAASFRSDKRAHLQIDGKAVALTRRVALSGSRYSGSGIVLHIGRTGTTIKRGKRPVAACSLQS
jgi:membrane-bound inhibitor of C-type lysozyme